MTELDQGARSPEPKNSKSKKEAGIGASVKYRFFDDNWKQATYIAAAIVLVVSFFFAFTLGKYHPVAPYYIPIGNATRPDGTSWTLFNRPWIIPRGSSASLTDTIIGIGLAVSIFPIAYVSYNNHKYLKAVEANIPRFLRDILESTDSGVILPKALIQASLADYGPISREIGIAMTKFSLGYDFRDSIMEAASKLKHPNMLQVGQVIVEAYSAGGKMHDVLNSSVVLFNGLEEYTEEKESELRPYTQLVYISIMIFLVIAYIILSQFIAPLGKIPQPQIAAGGLPVKNVFSVNLSKISPVYFESVFFFAGLLESLFGGIVIGKLVDGSPSAGLRHSLVLLVITILVFNAPIIGVFSVL